MISGYLHRNGYLPILAEHAISFFLVKNMGKRATNQVSGSIAGYDGTKNDVSAEGDIKFYNSKGLRNHEDKMIAKYPDPAARRRLICTTSDGYQQILRLPVSKNREVINALYDQDIITAYEGEMMRFETYRFKASCKGRKHKRKLPK